MSDLSRRLVDRALSAGVAVDAVQLSALERYLELLARWNAAMNLTALPLEGFPQTTLDRLISEPLIASRFVRHLERDSAVGAERVHSLFDLGSGGGSPALPLKIVRPDLRLTMVESKERKGAFLREAVRLLDLTNAEVVIGRHEDISYLNVDTITVRAIAGNEVLASTVRRMLAPDGRALLFGAVRPDLAGLDVEVEAPLIAVSDHLFVLKRSAGA